MSPTVAERPHQQQATVAGACSSSAIFPEFSTGYTSRVPRRRSEPPKNQLAKQVWELRMALGLTQEQFAARAKLQRETIADWERGAANPDGASIDKVMKAFPEARRTTIGMHPSGNGRMSDPEARLTSIRKTLEEALERNADKYTVLQALGVRREIDDLSARVGAGEMDTSQADAFVDLLARLVGPKGRGDRG